MSVLENFTRIAKIPRESGHEGKIRRFLVDWAENEGLECVVDATGNVIIRCPATKGLENVPPVALQGHMDMVCVKRPGSKHDFATDPIDLVLEDGILSAKDTSLGADNGVAMAMAMDIFTDKTCRHGELEAIFTINEEVGLGGAYGLDPALVRSRRMINLDSEEEGVIYIGSAGGADVVAVFNGKKTPLPERQTVLSLSVGGLRSGHSGGEIHLQRANAIKVLARMLHYASKKVPIRLISIDGGTKRNAIPAEAQAVFAAPSKDAAMLEELLEALSASVKAENQIEEPGMTVSIGRGNAGDAYGQKDSQALIDSLFMAPHGVLAMSKTIQGIVQTSCNLAIVRTEGETVTIQTSQRSSVASQRDAASERMAMILATSGAEASVGDGYPAWEPNPDSPLAKACAEVWKRETGREPLVTAIHAGLECGIINSKIPGMDSISIGPDLRNVHTVNERMDVASAERLCAFVKKLLEALC